MTPFLARSLAASAAALGCLLATTNLRAYTIVEFDTTLGNFDVELFDSAAPLTVANFLSYVASGAYDGTIIHRSVPNFDIQGGGYTDTQAIPTGPPIPLEYGMPNARGTLGEARAADPNSGTSQWYFNLVDNSQYLAPSQDNPGYAVFGQVLGNGMAVIDAIAALPVFALGPDSQQFPSLPGDLPLRNFTNDDYQNGVQPTSDNYVYISSVHVVPEPSSLALAAMVAVVLPLGRCGRVVRRGRK